MADPGYGPNGERTDPTGLVSWQAQPPMLPITAGDDRWRPAALGTMAIPNINQYDEDVWKSAYPGAV